METTITGKFSAELRWDDGKLRGDDLSLPDLYDLAAQGMVYAGPEWPTIETPDLSKHHDWFVTALAVLGMGAEVVGDPASMQRTSPGAVS